MGFNNKDYEQVKQRKKRFYDAFPDGRIIVSLLSDVDVWEGAMIKASVYTNAENQEKNIPRATGFALEIRDKELQRSSSGKEYESVNFSSWVENCEESAVGRALDNAGFASNMNCSAEEIEKAKRNKQAILNNTPKPMPKTESPVAAPTAPSKAQAPKSSTQAQATVDESLIAMIHAKVKENQLSGYKVRSMIQAAYGTGKMLADLTQTQAEEFYQNLGGK